MINPFSRTSFRNSDYWRARAQAIQDHIKHWSLSELLSGRRAGEQPPLSSGSGHGHGYDPNQPRVPAGHPDGGQWTKFGAHTLAITPPTGPHGPPSFFGGFAHGDFYLGEADARAFSRTNYAAAGDRDDAEPSVEIPRINGARVGTNLPWRQYAELGGLSAEDRAAVEETTEILKTLLARVNGTAARVPGLTAQAYGRLVHVQFAIAVKSLKLPEHLRHLTLQVEQSFDELGPTRYGQPGSIRTDVILRNAQGVIIAIYDVKTGDAEMRSSTEQKYREYTKVHPTIRPIILRAQRVRR
ncbi:MAG: hypothetical protein K2Y71_02820 [Xanthobacteraceae bacterium]|nr:hypothetical protein [Xanthobacteraceae bacterium]